MIFNFPLSIFYFLPLFPVCFLFITSAPETINLSLLLKSLLFKVSLHLSLHLFIFLDQCVAVPGSLILNGLS